MNHTILVEGIECYAFHGCMEEEGIIGQRYTVNVKFEFDFSKAAVSDNLSDTIDYVLVNKIVTNEMQIRSKLIEHAAGRILTSLSAEFPSAAIIFVTLTKFNPPVNGNIKNVSVTISNNK